MAVDLVLSPSKPKKDGIVRRCDRLRDKLSKAEVGVALDALKGLGDIPARFRSNSCFRRA